ncbi:MAG TPA: CRISPR-associated endonuclease Cas1 [Candidatus Aquicultor sp.]|jgi:CRISPR-associated protein Cas1
MDKRALVLTGHGLDIRVQYGGLKIRDGFPHKQEIRDTFINRGLNDIEHIVILGQSGSITFDALKWIADQDIAVTFVDYNGELLTDFIPKEHTSGVTKRRQALATQELNLKIATWLLQEKFKAQAETLKHISQRYQKTTWLDTARVTTIQAAVAFIAEKVRELKTADDVNNQRAQEAITAAYYWECFSGIPLMCVQTKKIPQNWLSLNKRHSPKTHSPRKAIDPFNAALNYLYSVLEVMIKHAAIAKGLDVDFGVMHADRSNRTSLVFDLMEPIRPKVDVLLLDWFMQQTFEPKDFFETREGVCRISQDISKEIIPLLNDLNPNITKVIKEFAGFFKDKHTIAISVSDQSFRAGKGENKTVCLCCNEEFIPKKPGQLYCSEQHKNKHHRQMLRAERKENGQCIQCGKHMDGPRIGANGRKVYSCEECSGYYSEKFKKWKQLQQS